MQKPDLAPMSMEEINQKYNFSIENQEYSSINNYELKEPDLEECTGEEYMKTLSFPEDQISSYKDGDFDVLSYSEGAAGSIYQTYDYIFKSKGKCYVFEITEQIPHCGNYYMEEPEISECQNKQDEGLAFYNTKIKKLLSLFN